MSPRSTSNQAADEAAVEGTIADDAEKQPLKPVSDERAAIPRSKPSNRTGRSAMSVPEGAKAPQDHQAAQADLDAQRREALDEDGLLTVEFNGEEFTFDPGLFDFEFQLLCERGLPARALIGVIGEKRFMQCKHWPAAEMQALMNALADGAGLGNS